MNSLKMSKSLKNIVKVDEFIEKYNAEALRFLMLSTHYRQPLNYTESVATAAYERYNSLLRTWCATYYRLEFLKRYSIVDIKEVGKYKIQFEQALKDDLNTPNAISVIYEIEKELNKLLKIREWNDEQIIKSFSLLATFEIFLNILGFEHKFNKPTKEDFKMLTDWKEAKANKNYEKADEIRDIMNKKGIPLM